MAEITNKLVGKAYLTKQFRNYNATVVAPQFVTLNEHADGKVVAVEGYDLSKNDFTDELKTKLTGLENYVDTDLRSDISDNADAIEVLNGTVNTEGSVANVVNKRIVELVAAADGETLDYDTLGKVSTWIAGHVESADDMKDAIKANADDIKALQDQQAAAAYTLETTDLDFSDINDPETTD